MVDVISTISWKMLNHRSLHILFRLFLVFISIRSSILASQWKTWQMDSALFISYWEINRALCYFWVIQDLKNILSFVNTILNNRIHFYMLLWVPACSHFSKTVVTPVSLTKNATTYFADLFQRTISFPWSIWNHQLSIFEWSWCRLIVHPNRLIWCSIHFESVLSFLFL
jgi:hypothetical protein